MLVSFKTLLFAITAISFCTFIALFGRLPAFRDTPIGSLHRLLLIHIPSFLRSVDYRFCGGHVSPALARLGNYLMHDKHPLVLIMFIGLLVVSECMFIPKAWPRLGSGHRLLVPLVATPPYIYIYLAATSNASRITASNHAAQMRAYPYDHVLYKPGIQCRTCKLLKPARSKHCSICKACVAKHDHHCIWVNNCLGRDNYVHFIYLLISVTVLLCYGAYLGYALLSQRLKTEISRPSGQHWSTGMAWSLYFQYWSWALSQEIRIGAVGLLAFMCMPLSGGFLIYHIYLIWAGMTTNESSKWADWREAIYDGLVLKASKTQSGQSRSNEAVESEVKWPVSSDQLLIHRSVLEVQDEGEGTGDKWKPIYSLAEVENIYDLGFWDNLHDVFWNRR
ncbi:DHHC zinc finger domain protein [Xylona heveae TC161]|uniref:Palmitoyltransferase n=1 Tax=Xylona heveae (strain CBS 132557 / TC161) TaxID=1328760 RepID=A0A165FN06_XYLHT|nr:DHHC zinc finger domain protein [Xylona heveae TC161]KZF21176.1 DHHC zinc finger domain protein [Xylona heveae TC161]